MSSTWVDVSIFKPPNVNVMPQPTEYASNGGFSSTLAQFVLSIARPTVVRPSLTLGSNGTSRLIAAL